MFPSTDHSTRDRSTYHLQSQERLKQRARHALPVPILRGARLVHVANNADLPASQRNDDVLYQALQLHTPQQDRKTDQICTTRASYQHLTLKPETSRRKSCDLHHPEPNLGPQIEAHEPLPTALPTTSSDVTTHDRPGEVAQDQTHPWTGSKNYLNPALLSNAAQQQPLLVNRAIFEYGELFSEHANLGVALLPELRDGGLRIVEPASASGESESEYGIAAHLKRTQRLPSCRSTDNEHAVQPTQTAQCIPTDLTETEAATTISASSRRDIAGAAEQVDLLRPATPSTGSRTKADTTRWATSTGPSLARADGSRIPSGCPRTPPFQRHPPLLHSPLQMPPARLSTSPSLEHRRLAAITDSLRKPSPSPSSEARRLLADRSVKSEIYPPRLRMTTTPAMVRRPSRHVGRDVEMSLVIPSADGVAEMIDSPVSPSFGSRSEMDSEDDGEAFETPMTSPGSSPMKMMPGFDRYSSFADGLGQLDGGRGSHDESPTEEEHITAMARARVESSIREAFGLLEESAGALPEPSSRSLLDIDREAQHDQDESRVAEKRDENIDSDLEDIATPLVPASPAKCAHAFPFPQQSKTSLSLASRSSPRPPSALLSQCERKATPRQRRLMTGGVQSPDRFIPSRAGTPTKDTLLLTKPKPKVTGCINRARQFEMMDSDPFGPTPRRSLRMAEQYATIRNPPPVPRPAGMSISRVPDAQPRAASAGSIWTVGGSTVTEGVASITNGRGGRVTSGTSAPHYTAGFLRMTSPSEEEVTHGRRLALAMGIEQNTRMLAPSPIVSGAGPWRRVWRDGGWQEDGGVVTPTKIKANKTKEVPIIPFRVLDAPALRDDYYCSLLAYSPTVQCLAVGLGPHVYLWSECRATTNIPDSLTAPYGSAHVTSLAFSSQEGGGAILAIGRADGRITLWSPLDRDPRFDSEQPSPVSCVCFRPNTVRRQSLRDPAVTVGTEELLVGDEAGHVYLYSIEWPSRDQRDLFDWHGSMTLVARISCHSQQVCGLAWSGDGEYFATGGNDNQLFLFDSKKILLPRRGSLAVSPIHVRSGSSGSSSDVTVAGQGDVLSVVPGQERHVFTLNAAVKAIAFSPWQPSLIAAGGGSNDRCIHFFHTLSGASLATIDCHAQVTSLVWSEKRKEIAATFGFAQPEHAYRVAVFMWPSCDMVVGIPWWSEERALYAVAYPRGPSSGVSGASSSRLDAEGRPWYGRRTKEEGCLVVATSDASIKFHEIWAEHRDGVGRRGPIAGRVLGGSQILEGQCSGEVEGWGAIR